MIQLFGSHRWPASFGLKEWALHIDEIHQDEIVFESIQLLI